MELNKLYANSKHIGKKTQYIINNATAESVLAIST